MCDIPAHDGCTRAPATAVHLGCGPDETTFALATSGVVVGTAAGCYAGGSDEQLVMRTYCCTFAREAVLCLSLVMSWPEAET